ncbi:hypothetical protein DTW90_30670 [Neorhizobium sp. P12A]|nr:hypothetical protein DTW90_30670 [Neorhizobium sp. P12A]
MDGWLKALVACACGVVIASGGWYATSAALDWQAQRNVAQQQATLADQQECATFKEEKKWRNEGGKPRTLDSDGLLSLRIDNCASN